VSRLAIMDVAVSRAAISKGGRRLPLALAEELRIAIAEGRLQSDRRLPPTRRLARELRVARNVVVEAYAILIAEGFAIGRRGEGTLVPANTVLGRIKLPYPGKSSSRGTRRDACSATTPQAPPFDPCVPDTAFVGTPEWRSCWRYAAGRTLSGDYGDPAGEASFRQEIARHLSLTLGWTVDPNDIVVTNGALEALNIVARAVVARSEWIALESPGWPAARQALIANGMKVGFIKVDGDGIDVDDLFQTRHAPRAVVVTPAHQFPIGGRLSIQRRQRLVRWADRNNAWIIEDDYDSAFRFDVPALPPLAAINSRARTVHISSFSKTLTPDLRLGYVICPPALTARIRQLKALLNYQTASTPQLAVERFLREGYYNTHLGRMKRLYACRRQALISSLAEFQTAALVQGVDAGLHLFWKFPSAGPTKKIEQVLGKAGIRLASVADYSAKPDSWHGYILGYSSPRLDADLERLNRALSGR